MKVLVIELFFFFFSFTNSVSNVQINSIQLQTENAQDVHAWILRPVLQRAPSERAGGSSGSQSEV